MLKVLSTILLAVMIVFGAEASEEMKKIESLILSEISSSLIGKKDRIKVYLTDNMKYIIKYSKIFIPVQECDRAEIIIAGEDLETGNCRGKLMIVTRYYLIHKYTNAVAAFYWHKGRPNIIFISERLKHFKISIPKKYNKYIDSEKNL
ncbi:hypothetical protein [Persephonella sp.]